MSSCTSSIHAPQRLVSTGRRAPHAAPAAGRMLAVSSSSEASCCEIMKPPSIENPVPDGGERTLKNMGLPKALTISEGSTVMEACKKMARRQVDAAILTDKNGMLSGIVTDKDIVVRVIAEGLRPEHTIVSKVMTRNPNFVTSDTLIMEALQKMVQGKFRHLPVVENEEVIALLDMGKCLDDTILRMEKASEQGDAIAAAFESVEHRWGDKSSAPHAFLKILRDGMFVPALSTIITENTKVVVVSPSDPVYVATTKMRENRVSSVVVVSGGKPHGILTAKDVLMRVVSRSLSPELTPVEKVMTAEPECAQQETTILDALHLMHVGKFFHLPVLDQNGQLVTCLDVLQITRAAISLVDGGSCSVGDMATVMMQKFWDAAPLETSDEEYGMHSDISALHTSEHSEGGKMVHPNMVSLNSFTFKFKDRKGRMHRFNCGTHSLSELLTIVEERTGSELDKGYMQLQYEDDEGDRVVLLKDSDLVGAVNNARSAGHQILRLHVECSISVQENTLVKGHESAHPWGWTSLEAGVLAGAFFLAGVGITAYLKRSD